MSIDIPFAAQFVSKAIILEINHVLPMSPWYQVEPPGFWPSWLILNHFAPVPSNWSHDVEPHDAMYVMRGPTSWGQLSPPLPPEPPAHWMEKTLPGFAGTTIAAFCALRPQTISGLVEPLTGPLLAIVRMGLGPTARD